MSDQSFQIYANQKPKIYTVDYQTEESQQGGTYSRVKVFIKFSQYLYDTISIKSHSKLYLLLSKALHFLSLVLVRQQYNTQHE